MARLSYSGVAKTRLALTFSIMGALALSACGSDGDSSSGSEKSVINYALTTTNINPYELPGHQAGFGELSDGSEVKEQAYSSSNVATQLLAAGKVDIIEASVLGILPAVAAGVPMKVFCPYVSMAPNVLVGIGDVDSIDDLNKPATRVAIESPGGPTALATDLVLMNKDAGFTTEDMPNKVILESRSVRFAALMAGDADAAIVDYQSLLDLRGQYGDDVHVISELAVDAADGIYVAFIAQTDWLEEHRDQAVAFCAAVMNSMVELENDYDQFVAKTRELLESDISDEVFKNQWDAVRAGHLWPYDRGISEESYEKVDQISQLSGLTEASVPYDTVVDESIYEDAKELVTGG
jgi:ABC-type nitrate/sulfonate/bicarbonate transport system substrate-binding protein